ncbi:MAG: fumarylacetoacetate hydrolase family protein [Arenicellales bacterium]
MHSKPELDTIARRIKLAQDETRQLEPITSTEDGFDLSDAYAVADRIHRARCSEGAVPLGRKIGFTNSNIWPTYGVHAPIWGYLYGTTVVHAREGRAVCSLSSLAEPKIEPEIAVHFSTAPPADGDLPAILECIDWVAHAFEIVQSHYPGWKFQAPDTAADSALHGALVVGEPLSIDELGTDPIGALGSFSVTLSRGGEAVESGKGSNVLGGPLQAVAYLIATLTQQSHPPLQAGEMVTTGTLTSACTVQAGQRWTTEFAGIRLQGLSVDLE